MLQALLHSKIDRWLSKDAYSIEDLLTSVVLGSASYVEHGLALLPFLGCAVSLDGQTLDLHLKDARVVNVEFWPNWPALELQHGDEDQADGDDGDDDDEDEEDDGAQPDERGGPGSGPLAPEVVSVPRSQPEVVIELVRGDGAKELVLIEAKLYSGKSSHAQADETVNDQLGKYWLQLREEAARRGATPRAVVYLTISGRLPRWALEETQEDLRTAGKPAAPLYWLSWRRFAEVVDESSAPPMLRDCVSLLKNRWQLVNIRMEPWPVPPAVPPPYAFDQRFAWTPRGARPSPWLFRERSST